MSKRDTVIAGAALGGLAYLATAGICNLLTSPFRAVKKELDRSNNFEGIYRNESYFDEEVTITHYREEPAPQQRRVQQPKVIDMGTVVETPYDEFDINNMVQGERQRQQQELKRQQEAAWNKREWDRHASTRAELQRILTSKKKKFLGIF